MLTSGLSALLGKFGDVATALIHAGVVMSERWRRFRPLKAASGILVSGVSTAVLTVAVIDAMKYNEAELQHGNQLRHSGR